MELVKPYHLSLLAEGCEKAGSPEEGLNVLVEALEKVNSSGERVYEAELHRLKGRMTLQQAKLLAQLTLGEELRA